MDLCVHYPETTNITMSLQLSKTVVKQMKVAMFCSDVVLWMKHMCSLTCATVFTPVLTPQEAHKGSSLLCKSYMCL